jgi:hypothetical protein
MSISQIRDLMSSGDKSKKYSVFRDIAPDSITKRALLTSNQTIYLQRYKAMFGQELIIQL